MIQLQKGLKPWFAEKINPVPDERIEKLVRRQHILADGIRKIIAARREGRINGRKMPLYIRQFLVDASQSQAEWLHVHRQQ